MVIEGSLRAGGYLLPIAKWEGVALPEDRISWHFRKTLLREVFSRKIHMFQSCSKVQGRLSCASKVFPA